MVVWTTTRPVEMVESGLLIGWCRERWRSQQALQGVCPEQLVDKVALTDQGKTAGRSVVGYEAGGEFWVQLSAEDLNLEAVSTLIVFKARKLAEIIREVSVDRGRASGTESGAPQ